MNPAINGSIMSPVSPRDRTDISRVATSLPGPENLDCEGAWEKQNLLSLDGGGIRGYWSLLLLDRLMEEIARIEVQDSSFHPQPYPDHVTHIPPEGAESQVHGCGTYRYLPCHYFDYICGTSTGALIAIMLGRFRMTVGDCLSEYTDMSPKIFSRSRPLSQPQAIITPWCKYSGNSVEKAVQDVVRRRCENRCENTHELDTDIVLFTSRRGLCRTAVTTKRCLGGKGIVGADHRFHMIRSYDHPKRDTKDLVQSRTPSNHNNTNGIVIHNYGDADMLEVWQVARATTAAPAYFPEFSLRTRSNKDKKYLFQDAGFGEDNNPVYSGLSEIMSMHGVDNLGITVSVGTAHGATNKSSHAMAGHTKKAFRLATNPRIRADLAESLYRGQQKLDCWFRFDDEEAVPIKLDKVKPSGYWTAGPGSKTLSKMENHFHRWLRDHKNISMIQDCAKQLVQRRELRSRDASRWERYATGADYHCVQVQCRSQIFCSKDDYERHVTAKHGDLNQYPPYVKRWTYRAPPTMK